MTVAVAVQSGLVAVAVNGSGSTEWTGRSAVQSGLVAVVVQS